jgi:hypothetical protein
VTSQEAVVAVIDALHQSQVDYMLVGSLASNLYGIARSTNDADFVLQLGDMPLQHVTRHLGPQFRLDPKFRSKELLPLLGTLSKSCRPRSRSNSFS